MSQENAPNKPVHLIYLCGGVLVFFMAQWTIEWLWGYFLQRPSEVVTSLFAFAAALICGIGFYRNDRAYTMVNEVASELKKVTWPSAKEVRSATIVVIVISAISGLILFLFDLVWSKLTELVYG
ncbi:MAG: preprotein translocase subunit SecE [Kofleriaceae bacterium]